MYFIFVLHFSLHHFDRQKRSNITPITFSNDPSPPKKASTGGQRKPHVPRAMYHPPSGKYSSKAGTAPSDPEFGPGYGE